MRTPTIRVPGDKSVSHRALMLACLGRGTSRLRGLLDADDVRATAGLLEGVGARLDGAWGDEVRIEGPVAFHDADRTLDCGNSGTTARLGLGLLTGAGVGAVVDGDDSLRRRPMERVVYPLQAVGGRLSYRGRKGRLPVELEPRATGSLRTLRHRPRVASAQVKSCLLLAGLLGGVRIEVVEPGRSRDHTERMLAHLGAPLEYGPHEDGARASLAGGALEEGLDPLEMEVPGDLSSAAFLVGAALLAGRSLRLSGVGVNPTRAGFLDVLERAGARVRVEGRREAAGEPVADLAVDPGGLEPFSVDPGEIPTLLDEVPLLAVLAARIPGTSRIRGAEELRVKESDRLARLARNLESLGIECEELEDGLRIHGAPEARIEGTVETGGDHRIAMAFGVLGRSGPGEVRVDDPACVGVSYPGFWEDLDRAVGEPAARPEGQP